MKLEELLSEEMERQRGKGRRGEEIGRERGRIVQESQPLSLLFFLSGSHIPLLGLFLFLFPLSWLVYFRAKSFWVVSGWEEAPKIVLP